MFCDTLKMLRKQRKIKQSEMAAALNVTQGAIANWENGIRAPSIDALPDIARLLDVSIDQLFGIQPTPQIILTDEEKRVLSAYMTLDVYAAYTADTGKTDAAKLSNYLTEMPPANI